MHYTTCLFCKCMHRHQEVKQHSLEAHSTRRQDKCTSKAFCPLQMEISMAQKASTFDTRRATGMKPMMSNTRTCHQASPLQTLGADLVLPGLHKAMARIDIVATTWLILMLHTLRLRPLHLCKQQARYVYTCPHSNTNCHQQWCQSHACCAASPS